MIDKQSDAQNKIEKGTNRMPSDSAFFEKILPIVLIGLAGFTILLILVAVGILTGIIPF